MSDLFRPTKIVTGTRRVPVRPPRTVKPPTESGDPPTLDPQGWIESTDESNVEIETGVAGDIIVIFAFAFGGTGTFSTPSGYTEVGQGSDSDDEIACFAKVADGTESSTLSIPSAGSVEAYWTNRIHANGATLTLNTEWAFDTVNNPGAITLADSSFYFAVTAFLKQHTGSNQVVTPPTGYSGGGTSTQPGVRTAAVAQKNVSSSGTEDPSEWGFTADGGVSAATCCAVASFGVGASDPSVSPFDHDHVEADITDLDHWTETDHDALDHSGLTGVPGSIDDLSDVDTTTAAPATGDLLEWDGTNWVPVDEGLTTKGDVLVHDGTNYKRLAVGSDDQVLTADSAESTGVKWAVGGGGGGGGSISRVGRTTVGASWLGPSTFKYARKESFTAGDVVLSVGLHLQMTASNVAGQFSVGIFTDDTSGTSQPGQLLGVGDSVATSDDILFDLNEGRWFYAPLGVYIPSTGSYWFAFFLQDPNNTQIAYDATGGTAAELSAGGTWWTEFGALGHSFTSRAYDLSMHAVVMS